MKCLAYIWCLQDYDNQLSTNQLLHAVNPVNQLS